MSIFILHIRKVEHKLTNDRSLEKLELQLAMMVRRVKKQTANVNKEQHLKSASYLILLLISESGPMGVKQIASLLHLDISTVSRQAAELQEEGKLSKQQSQTDGRAYDYQLTSKGIESLNKAHYYRQERFRKLTDEWDDDDIEVFAYLLKKFNDIGNNND